MKKFIALIMLLGFLGAAYAIGFYRGASGGLGAVNFVSEAEEKAAIVATLNRQDAAWNRGDIDAFMQDYLRSDDLRFASGGTVKYGWQTTLERYKARYPDKTAMGQLAFTDLEIDIFSTTGALVFGRWTLTREADAPNGLFTLHMRKGANGWKIVSDHTSSSDTP